MHVRDHVLLDEIPIAVVAAKHHRDVENGAGEEGTAQRPWEALRLRHVLDQRRRHRGQGEGSQTGRQHRSQRRPLRRPRGVQLRRLAPVGPMLNIDHGLGNDAHRGGEGGHHADGHELGQHRQVWQQCQAYEDRVHDQQPSAAVDGVVGHGLQLHADEGAVGGANAEQEDVYHHRCYGAPGYTKGCLSQVLVGADRDGMIRHEALPELQCRLMHREATQDQQQGAQHPSPSRR
mmetsp:Transcript_98752/g.235358  ORF Transcript_98752/g.235358 Transcript_98752/m.235358 type:complete len:233 (-) Transcript_98752:229-927(-)